MSLATIYSRALVGIQAPAITVEVHITSGMPGFLLVGLAETSVKEARDRVRSALLNNGFIFPSQRITINLAPADLPKEGGRFDLPIALGILAASKQIPCEQLNDYEFLGELGLSGTIRWVTGVIPAALAAEASDRKLILGTSNEYEITLVEGDHLLASNLLAVCSYLHNKGRLMTAAKSEFVENIKNSLDLQDVIGQQQAKRALEIAAAGGHHLLFLGPPGTGKTMLAKRLSLLLPPLTKQEALESAAIINLTMHKNTIQTWQQRPFRAPHHSASIAALIGGGNIPTPGEISLAHNGVLFLDELPEFERRTLDALRQPLETGEITIARANRTVCFPARFQLIAALNPGLHCGSANILLHSTQKVLRYLSRLSTPLLDRFDLCVEVPLLPQGMLTTAQDNRGENTDAIRTRVINARKLQINKRNTINSRLSNKEINQYCKLSLDDAKFLENALFKLGLSTRAWHKILKLARTIADLTAVEKINRAHLLEALSYRAMDRLLKRLSE